VLGKLLTSTTYHALHHSRYTGNYGLGTRVLDRFFGTEWEDYEPLYDRVARDRQPLKKLRERVGKPMSQPQSEREEPR
jgi:sterol desaturase/sphingolipid hydroxylase (fatty acid hydroxylase superfamily)